METSGAKKTGPESIDGTAADEILKQLFTPDITTAAEYQRVCRRRVRSAEAELMAAVLENGIADYQRFLSARDKKGLRRFAGASAWLHSDDSDWVFSFDNCCAVLDIDADYLRKGLQAWREAQIAAANSALRHSNKNIFHKAA